MEISVAAIAAIKSVGTPPTRGRWSDISTQIILHVKKSYNVKHTAVVHRSRRPTCVFVHGVIRNVILTCQFRPFESYSRHHTQAKQPSTVIGTTHRCKTSKGNSAVPTSSLVHISRSSTVQDKTCWGYCLDNKPPWMLCTWRTLKPLVFR